MVRLIAYPYGMWAPFDHLYMDMHTYIYIYVYEDLFIIVNGVIIIWLFCFRSWVRVCGRVALMWEVVWGFVYYLVFFC